MTQPTARALDVEARVQEMRSLSSREFDTEVRTWATSGRREGEEVFGHPALVQRTKRALTRLLAPGAAGGGREVLSPAQFTSARAARARLTGRSAVRGALRHARPEEVPVARELPPRAQNRLEELAHALKYDRGTFEDAVFMWATSGTATWEEDAVFQSAALAHATSETLRRLQRENRAEEAEAATAEEKTLLRADGVMLGQARNALKPYVNLALAARARNALEKQALELLRKVYYPQYCAIIAELKAGRSGGQAYESAKAQRDLARYGPEGPPPPRKRTRRKRKRASAA